MSPRALVIGLRRACLLAFLAFVVLFDSSIPFRPAMLVVALVAGACTTSSILLDRRNGVLVRERCLFPGYAIFLGGVALSAVVSGASGVWAAVVDQICFVLLVWSVADDARPRAQASDAKIGDVAMGAAAWLVAVILCLALALPQLGGPRSGFDFGRAYNFLALDQWGGYPELGVLCLLGGAGVWALCVRTTDRVVQGAGVVLATLFAAGLAFLQSRAALAAFAAVVAWTALAAAWRWRSWLAVAGLVAGSIGGVGIVWRYPDVVHRVTTASAATVENDRPLGIRREIWGASQALVRAHPWTGVGPGQFQRAYTRSGASGLPLHAHNLPLHVAAEYGLPTMIVYLALWGRLLWRTWREAGSPLHGSVSWALHAMLFAFLLRNLGDHFLGGLTTSLRMLSLVAFIVGLAESLASRR